MTNLVEPIDHDRIDPDALKVVQRLVRYRHEAYLVGGCVRDLLLDCTPKDFDVATSATPNQIRSLFRNARVIGRRFRLVHIFFGPKIIETSTFRKNPREPEIEEPALNDEGFAQEDDGPQDDGPRDDGPVADHDEAALLIRQDNVFGTAEDDALRRDFTMNALFYDPVGRKVIDFAEGRADLEHRLIRTIGDPAIRFQEDPVRMLRAIKFAARLDLTIEPQTYAALVRHRESIRLCAKARVLEEIYRLLREGASAPAMRLLIETGVQEVLLPELTSVVGDPDLHPVLFARLESLDSLSRVMPITNALLLSALSLGTVVPREVVFGGPPEGLDVLEEALHQVLAYWTPSRRDRDRTRQILMAQRRIAPDQGRRRKRRPSSLASQEYFPEALSLYKLCCQTGEADPSTLERWESLAAARASERSSGRSERRSPALGRPSSDRPGASSSRGRRRRGGRGRSRGRQEGERSNGEGASRGGGGRQGNGE